MPLRSSWLKKAREIAGDRVLTDAVALEPHGHDEFTRDPRLGVSLPTFGHAADGNVHTHLLRGLLTDGLVGPDLPDWREKRERAREAIFRDVAGRRGVISGEHGIGLSKRASFRQNLSPAHLSALQAIKKALDPYGILNPGKIFEM